MTALFLVAAPTVFQHRPTRVEAMRFTAATRQALEQWLTRDLGREHFSMGDDHLVIETTQGDSRDCYFGCWVIKRRTRDGYEFYPVEHEVIADSYDEVAS